jgi:predicted naringenin-chalcone synthase
VSPTIHAIGTAVPENAIVQANIAQFMSTAHGLNEHESRQLNVLYRATGIRKRHSVIHDYSTTNPEEWDFYPNSKDLKPFPSTAERGDIYKKNAIILSRRAIKACFKQCDISLKSITHLITVSCTGMYAPGLDIDLINELGLNKSVDRCSINFMGCYAAITALKQATAICKSDNKANVLVVCVELCTLHFQNNKTDENLLANALFSDGAAAMILSNDQKETGISLEPIDFHCELIPEGDKEMAWQIGDHGFQMKLSNYVPDLIGKGIGNLIKKLTANLSSAPAHYAFHPGGKRILEVIEKELDLTKEQNFAAYDVLKNYGNMSSPTVLFVLNQLMSTLTEENKGETILSLAFGPGLTLESMILKIS